MNFYKIRCIGKSKTMCKKRRCCSFTKGKKRKYCRTRKNIKNISLN